MHEWLKDVRNLVGRNPASRIAYRETDPWATPAHAGIAAGSSSLPALERYGPSRIRELDRVRDEINENLPDSILITDVADSIAQLFDELYAALFGGLLHQRRGSIGRTARGVRVDLHRQLSGIYLRQIEQLIHQTEKVTPAGANTIDVVALLVSKVSRDTHVEQVGVA